MNIVGTKRGEKGAHNSLLKSAGLAMVLTLPLLLSACGKGGESSTSSPPTPPSTPTNVTATAGNAQVTVSWTAVTGATSYNVYHRTTTGVTTANGTKVTGATLGGAVTGLTNGTTYYFVVTAVNAGGESAASGEANAAPQAPPSAPTGVSATAGNGQASVSWTAVTGATSYNVYYGTSAGVTAGNGTKVTGATSGGAITLTNGTAYYFVVTAVNAAGESAVSSEVNATPQVSGPGVPAGVSAIVGDTQIKVSWNSVAGATSYNVYYGTSAGVTAANGTKLTGVSSGGWITGLTNGTAYYFVVTAVNAAGESVVSSEVNATPQVPASGAPTGIGASAGNAQVTVSWSSVAGATSYNVYYATVTGVTAANGTKVANVSSPKTITGLTNGTTHYFIVTAVNAGGESSASVEANASPQAPPSAPTGIGATAGNTQVTVSWTAVTGATSYNIYYGTSAGVTAANGTKVSGATSGNAITGLTNGTALYFVVTALTAGSESVVSAEVGATPQVPAPGAPGGVLVTAGNGQASVSWNSVTGATSYNVYYGTTAGVTTSGTKVSGATSGNAITGLTNGTTHYFVVTAVNAGGESVVSSEVSAMPQVPAPGTPTGVSATAGAGQVTLSWSSVTGATSYNVYYRTTAGVTAANGTKVTGATSGGAITGLTNGTTYYFVVTAVNSGVESATSSEVYGTCFITGGAIFSGAALSGKSTGGVVTTFVGPVKASAGSSDGAPNVGQFNLPRASVVLGANLYVADGSNRIVRKVDLATGVITTLAGTAGVSGSVDAVGAAAQFGYVCDIATDGADLYATDCGNATIRKIVIATATVTTIAGTAGTNGDTDGTGAAALFNYPYGITSDGTNLYVADPSNRTIRKIVIATGAVSTLAGTTGVSGHTDATGAAAVFQDPYGIATDGTNLYVTEYGGRVVRKIVIATGAVTTLAGAYGVAGHADGVGAAATFNMPIGIATDNGTNLWIADNGNRIIRKVVVATGEVTTVAGTYAVIGATDGTGAAATFNSPYDVATDNGANLYITDNGNNSIRKMVAATGAVTTLAGTTLDYNYADGGATAARFRAPHGITTDGTNLYVADYGNEAVRKIVIATGATTTLAGSTAGVSGSADGVGTAAKFSSPYGITTDGANLYVAEYGNRTIRKIVIATGEVSTLAGTAGVNGTTDGTGAAASFNRPNGITTDGTNLYVADTPSYTIRKIVIATGAVTTLAGTAGVSGTADGVGAAARFGSLRDLTTDGTNLYVADTNGYTIRKIVIATGAVTTLAGSGVSGSVDGTGTSAQFTSPLSITTDGTNLYVGDQYTIRKIVIATGVVTTVAGSGTAGNTDGTGTAAVLGSLWGITTDGTSLFVTSNSINNVRRIQ